MKATVVHVKSGGFVGRSESKHATLIDHSVATGGSANAPTPVEMVLMALGSCSAVDVVSILAKGRTPVAELSVELEGERRDAHPRIFTKIHMHFIVKGEGIQPAALERAIHLSESSYCSVAGMLRGTVTITTSSTIVP